MNPHVKLDRRRWIRNSALGALGGSFVTTASGSQPAQDPHRAERDRFLAGPGCQQVLKLSKRLVTRIKEPVKLFPAEPCKCECKIGDKTLTVFQVNYRAILLFNTAKPCDETELEPLLQFGTELWLNGTLTLRLEECREAGKPVLIGRNLGVYHIHRYRPNEGVMDGPFCGTEGVLPTEKEGERCCAPGHGLGSFCGEGVGKLKGWSLCASYHSLMKGLSPERLCEKSKLDEFVMDIDGVLIGPCKPIVQK